MKRRELIILALAAVGALYAVWSLFLAPAPGSGSAAVHLDRAGLTKTASDVRDMVAKTQPTALEAFTLARATSPFPRDPFYRTTTPGEIQATGSEPQAAFVYSGYLKLGDEVFAIINGIEYRIGEELEVADYFLASIERNKVTIEHRLPGQASSGQIVAPLSEVETALDKKESTGNGTAR